MNNFIDIKKLTNNSEIHILSQINECESCIAGWMLELETNCTLENLRNKETNDLINSNKAKKSELIIHYEKYFNKKYDAELHMAIAFYKQAKYLSDNCHDLSWRQAMWIPEADKDKAQTEYDKKLQSYKNILIVMHGLDEKTLNSLF